MTENQENSGEFVTVILNFYRNSHLVEKFYYACIVSSFLFLVTGRFFGLEIVRAIPIAFGVIALSIDLVQIYKKIWSYLLGKGFVLILYALITNFSIGYSAQIVNSVLGVEPFQILYSTTLISILSIPIYFFVVLGFVSFSIFIVSIVPALGSAVYQSYKGENNWDIFLSSKYGRPIIFRILRGILMIFLSLIVIGNFLTIEKKMDDFLRITATHLIYNYDAYSKSRCAIKKGEKALAINDNEVVIITKSENIEFVFELKKCKPRIE